MDKCCRAIREDSWLATEPIDMREREQALKPTRWGWVKVETFTGPSMGFFASVSLDDRNFVTQTLGDDHKI